MPETLLIEFVPLIHSRHDIFDFNNTPQLRAVQIIDRIGGKIQYLWMELIPRSLGHDHGTAVRGKLYTLSYR